MVTISMENIVNKICEMRESWQVNMYKCLHYYDMYPIVEHTCAMSILVLWTDLGGSPEEFV